MGKFEEMMRTTAANADESLGQGRDHTGLVLPQVVPPARLQGVTKSKNSIEIPVDRVQADPDQPREEFDEESLGRLADSLKQRGQLQPIRVRWDEGRGIYIIICGERRWRAAIRAGLTNIRAEVVEGDLTAAELRAIQLVENCLREDLRPIEQAKAFRDLMGQNSWSTRQLAAELALSQANIVRSLALLELPESIQEQVEQGNLAPSAAYEVSKIEDRRLQEEIGRQAGQERMTAVKVKEAVERVKSPRPRPRRLEYRDPNGCMVYVTVPEGMDDDDAISALGRAAKHLRKERASRPEAAQDAA